jgi:hypothetical protein
MALALGAAACGDDESAAGSCFDYSSFDGSSPATGFAAVAPIFQNSCGLSTGCHGTAPGTATQPYIGSDPAALRADNIEIDSQKEPGLKRVKAGDPANSFLMIKVDGTLECDILTCADDQSCGGTMPPQTPLGDDQKNTIRRWIAQGALTM